MNGSTRGGRGPLGAGGRRRQQGAAAVEFAFVFPVLFLLMYGLISFGLILLAQQSLTMAVAEGARAALRYSTNPAGAACQTVNQYTTWLGGSLIDCTTSSLSLPKVIPCPYLATSNCMRITVVYPYATKPLVPTLPLLSLVMPRQLSASVVVQLEPAPWVSP